MSEMRMPSEAISINARLNGKKTVKIELFPAHLWRFIWSPGCVVFYPRPPMISSDRNIYWSTRYRVRINGAWHINGGQYTMLTRDQVIDNFIKKMEL